MSIIAKNIDYSIGTHEILHDVSVNCDPGKMIALSGPSGSGKTTLLGILGLLTRPTAGTVSLGHQKDWSNARRRRFWQDDAGFIWQDYGIIDEESVAYNVTLRRHLNQQQTQRLEQILTQVGLAGRSRDIAATLSGGEKQRVGIARTVWKKAKYIFADEPTASLDEANREVVYRLLRDAVSAGACVVVSTHDQQLVDQCDTVVTLGRR